MTDEELLQLYTGARVKTEAIIKAAKAENVSLVEIADRLEKLGKYCRGAIKRSMDVCDVDQVTKQDIARYLRENRRHHIGPPKKTGEVSAYCKGCDYLNRDGTKSCMYFVITGRRRGCPAGDGCDKRHIRRRGN